MLAERLGKSRTSITETLSLVAMPEDVRQLCRLADIQSKSLLLQIVRQGDRAKMVSLIERLQSEGTTRREARRIVREGRKSRGRPRHYVFRYQPREKNFELKLQFRKSDVPREEIIAALEGLLRELRAASRH
jgi:ParB family chromosome partitioning protein